MKKQLLLLVMILLPMVANADSVEINGIYYNLNLEEKTAEVTQHPNKYSGELVIPENVDYEDVTYKVTSIEDEACLSCSDLTSVTIPGSVTSIGMDTFLYCDNLTAVKVIVTDFSAFCNNKITPAMAYRGKSIILLDNDENEIKEYIIPNNVTSIGDYAFYGCSGLTSVTIPNSVTSIGSAAFRECGITSIVIPESVVSIGQTAFVFCRNLKEVILSNKLTSIEWATFQDCNQLTSITIPDGVTSIASHVFANCIGLKTVILPTTLNSIGSRAFANCASLKEVQCKAKTIPSTKSDTFIETFLGIASLYVPKEAVEDYKDTAPWSAFGEIYSLTNTLTYYINGKVYKSFEIEYGKEITPEPAPTKEGYTFSGWSEIPETMPAHDVTVTGTFAINKYKLTYLLDGEVYKSFEIEYGKEITPEAEPTKEGYTFSGWSEIPQTMPAQDVTVTGTFSINKYKLTYLVDGETYKEYDVEYGESITPEPAPTKEGYSFSGWSNIPSTMPANDVTVTGTFSKGSYTLTYIVDGVTYKTVSYDYGETITPEPAPTKEGYTFSGWSEIPETMPANDVTVTGTFTVNKYTLTYMVDGEVYKSYEIEYGKEITPEAEPTKEGYTFSGWSEIPQTMPAQDVTVTGTFSINKYKLTYLVDGETYKEYDVEYGESITPEPAPTKEGYTFSGWSNIPQTMPAHDVTITGSFVPNKYQLTYKVDGEVYKSYNIEYGAIITPEPAPIKEGYTFSGWSWIPNKMPAEDVIVTGSFSINKYKLTYIVDGEVYKSYNVEYGASITPETEPTKEGFTFSGWSWIPTKMPAEDVSVSGYFNVNQYTITYIIDNEVYMTEKVDYGSTITPPTPPSREGYDFAWGDYPETMPAYDITIYGTYTTGVNVIWTGENSNVKIYSIDGKQLEKPQKGLNIIRMSDGTTKKVVVK